jgi:hypothetical protein
MRLESPQELNTPEIDLPPVNHIAKFAPGPLLQAAMDLASTTTDVSFHLSMAVRCGKYYFARSHGLSSALITSYLCDTVLLSSIPFVQALGPSYDVLPLRGMSGFPQYG